MRSKYKLLTRSVNILKSLDYTESSDKAFLIFCFNEKRKNYFVNLSIFNTALEVMRLHIVMYNFNSR